jgi:S-methylmethionine-dependent homocysteine/selenocysteine methylase
MVTILDGGMGGELIRRRVTPGNELWSAQALLDAPDAVLAVHRDYIGAGAQIITTNSYSTIPSYLGKLDLTARYIELTALAGRLARQAADEAPRPVQVAGSPPDEQALPIYRELATALAPYVDLYLCETMSCIRESVNAASAARSVGGPGKTIYLSWTLAESPGQGAPTCSTARRLKRSQPGLRLCAR